MSFLPDKSNKAGLNDRLRTSLLAVYYDSGPGWPHAATVTIEALASHYAAGAGAGCRAGR